MKNEIILSETKKKQIQNGFLRGTLLLHAAPLEIGDIIDGIKEKNPKNKSPLLEEATLAVTAGTEAFAYYWMGRRGITAYYAPLATNVLGLVARTAYQLALRE